MESTAFNHAAWNPLHSIGIHFTRLHGVHCIQSECMESTAFKRDALGHAAYNPLHSIGMHWASLHGLHCIQSGSIAPKCMESTAFNHGAPFKSCTCQDGASLSCLCVCVLR